MAEVRRLFVVPKDPSSYLGWWIGEVEEITGNFVQINILWVQYPEKRIDGITYRLKDFLIFFGSEIEAIEYLRKQGISV